MLNCDGGFISFKLAFSNFSIWEMQRGQDVSLFAMDSRSARKDLDPNYKAQRIYGKTEALQIVSDLRKHILEESKLPLCKLEHSESDDLVACWYLFNPEDKLVSKDKDFFQLPNLIETYNHDLEAYTKQQVLDKSSNFIYELACKNFVLYQALTGDVADNIPRLLGKGKLGKEQVIEIVKSLDNPVELAGCLQTMFDKNILTNLQLVLFPFYQFGDWQYDGQWFDDWVSGAYYNINHWHSYYNLIRENTKTNKVSETLSQLSLWGFDV